MKKYKLNENLLTIIENGKESVIDLDRLFPNPNIKYNDGTKTPQNEYVNRPTPLEAWQEVKDEMMEWTEGYEENFGIIETTLKEYEGAKNHIEALNKERVENSIKLKALEIIKDCVGLKMSVDEDLGCLYVPITKCFQPLEKNNIVIVGYVKGKDKIDLLKEILCE